MSIISPEKIVFETEADLIDYVTKGFVPTKKSFEKFMSKMYNPNGEDEVRDPNSNEVFIPDRVFFNCDRDTMDMVLRQVYANRVRNRNIMLTAIGVIGGIMLIGTIRGGHKKKDDDDIDFQSFSASDVLGDGPIASIDDI